METLQNKITADETNKIEKDNTKSKIGFITNENDIIDILKNKNKRKSYCSNIDFIKKSIIGELLDYELKSFLNYGSEGFIYSAVNKNERKIYAIKFIINKFEEKDQENKNIEREYNISLHFKDKNILKTYEKRTLKYFTAFIMEYCEYGDIIFFLKKLIKKNFLSEANLCYFIYQILKGLNNLHRNKIIHLDIKPQNIMIDNRLNAKIGDFSISLDYSKFEDSNSVTLPKNGTNSYIAPEILGGTSIKVKDLNKIDIYSLGVMSFVLAYGFFPYNSSNDNMKNTELIYKQIMSSKLKIPPLKSYSKGFVNFLEKCLNRDIKERYSIEDALRDPWINGYKLIEKSKHLYNNLEKFLICVVTDNIINYKKYKDQVDKEINKNEIELTKNNNCINLHEDNY